jgi:hypothetical protein
LLKSPISKHIKNAFSKLIVNFIKKCIGGRKFNMPVDVTLFRKILRDLVSAVIAFLTFTVTISFD